MSLTIQYVILGLIIAGAIVWAIVRFKKSTDKNNAGCCGCSLHDACKKKDLVKGKGDCKQ